MEHTSEEPDCDEVVSVDGTTYFIPVCDMFQKPWVDQKFSNFEAAIHFYEEYAGMVGFDIRHNTIKKDRGMQNYYEIHYVQP